MKLNVLFLFSFRRGRVIKMWQKNLCISTCLLTLSLGKTQICVFREYFSFNCFLTTFCCFWKLRLNFLNSALTFTQNQPNFFSQKELVYCWAANLSSKIACIFSETSKDSTRSLTVNIFVLGDEWKKNMRKRPSFQDPCRFFTLTYERRMVCVFPDYSSFHHLLATPSCF